MNTTHDDNATTWRDLADQLNDAQRAAIERLERETGGRAPAQVLLDYARQCIEARVVDMAYGDVPPPVGAATGSRCGPLRMMSRISGPWLLSR